MKLDGMSVSVEALEPRWLGAERRIPASLAELHGPSAGTVALPGWLAWSGRTEFDVADPGARLTLYQILVDVGQRDDVAKYMNADYLRADWPRLRRLIESPLRRIWEQRLSLSVAV